MPAASVGLDASYHGIAARLDRLPEGLWQNRITGLLGALLFCDCLDQYVGSGILATLLQAGWTNPEMNTFCVSFTMFGYLVGSIVAGFVSDFAGRKAGISSMTAVFAIATLAASFSVDMNMLITLRFVMGIGLGGAIVASYNVLGEYVTPGYRGRHSATLGLIANFSPPLGALMTMNLIPVFGWRGIYLIVGFASCLVGLVVHLHLPESPRWLASRGRNAQADAIVSATEHVYLAQGVRLDELDYARIAHGAQREDFGKPGWRVLLRKRNLKRLVGMSCALFAMNTLVYTISNWTPMVFMGNGVQVPLSLGITTVILLGCPFGILMLVIFADKHSRKVGLVTCLLALSACSYIWSIIPVEDVAALMIFGFVLCALLYYYALLACSVYLGELFPTQVRARGAGFANAFGRIAAVATPYVASSMLANLGIGSVYLFSSVICLIAAAMVALCCDETRYRTLEDINGHNS